MKGAIKHSPALRAVGLMSGTSLDGVDAAEIVTDGHTITAFGPGHYRPYSAQEQKVLRGVLGTWHGGDLGAAPGIIQRAHLEALAPFEAPDLIGFHGQTLAHEPRGRGTHQMGDGAALAQAAGVPGAARPAL